MDATYAEYVHYKATENVILQDLYQYLVSERKTQGKVSRPCRFICLEYSGLGNSGYKSSNSKLAKLDEIITEVEVKSCDQAGASSRGTILAIEDISPALVERIGSTFNIDPMFFAGYLGDTFQDIEKRPPPLYISLLPSQIASKDYINLHYHRPIKLERHSGERLSAVWEIDSNVSRTVKRLALLGEVEIALVRGCCAILKKKFLNGSWLCLILVDATDAQILPRSKSGGLLTVNRKLPQVSVYDAKCNISTNDGQFTDYASFRATKSPMHVAAASLLQSLEQFFQAGIPQFNPQSPSMLSLCYYPLRAVLADWAVYSITMSRYVKHYEYSLQNLPAVLREQDIRELQVWRRRATQSLQKLSFMRYFVEHWMSQDSAHSLGMDLIKDLDYISISISGYSRNLETMIPIITSMVQLLDTRRSLVEATGVKRLTYLALIFVPLSYVSSLFSMSEKWAPGNGGFWIYFVVAVPLLASVFGISWLSSYVPKLIAQRKTQQSAV